MTPISGCVYLHKQAHRFADIWQIIPHRTECAIFFTKLENHIILLQFSIKEGLRVSVGLDQNLIQQVQLAGH